MTVAAARNGRKVITDLCRCRLLNQEHMQWANELLVRQPTLSPREVTEHLVSRDILVRDLADEFCAVYEQRLTVWGFQLTEPLGRGSLGIVYKAQSTKDNREFAVKILPRRNVGTVSRVPQRLQAYVEFQRQEIARLIHVGTAGERHFLIWPYVSNAESLESHVQKEGTLAGKFVVHYALQIARGLQACHEAGLVHGLLKPSNIYIGANHQVHILDLGIGFLMTLARGESLLNTLTSANQVASFVECASPETILDTTVRTPEGDQYSLGCILYYCLTGRYPFPEEQMVKKMMAHQFKEPTPIRTLNPKLPRPLAEIVMRLLQKAPAARFGNMGEVAEALEKLRVRPGTAAAPKATMLGKPDAATAPPTLEAASGPPNRIVSLVDFAVPPEVLAKPSKPAPPAPPPAPAQSAPPRRHAAPTPPPATRAPARPPKAAEPPEPAPTQQAEAPPVKQIGVPPWVWLVATAATAFAASAAAALLLR
jgi:serine/threonine protein kinase